MEATDAKISFESALTQLETIVESMESGDVPLAELLAKFEEGNKLLKVCEARLKDAELKIEFKVAVNDIDQIALGQEVKLRFSAFNQRTTPEIDGRVSRVSAAATSDPATGHSYYLAEAEVTGDLSVLGDRGLIPGMPVDIFVQTEEQVAIAYFVKPFTDQIARAFREE